MPVAIGQPPEVGVCVRAQRGHHFVVNGQRLADGCIALAIPRQIGVEDDVEAAGCRARYPRVEEHDSLGEQALAHLGEECALGRGQAVGRRRVEVLDGRGAAAGAARILPTAVEAEALFEHEALVVEAGVFARGRGIGVAGEVVEHLENGGGQDAAGS